MDPERWNRIERFYHAALEHEPSGRAAFLAEVCPEPDLRSEVESLLGFDGSGDSMLEHPAWAKGIRAGERLGPYEILDRIGKGGMGEVWRARDPRLNREVAIKISAQQFSDRFEREARSIAALNHSHICTLFDVGPNYLVMELVEGATLAERIAQGPMPLEEALAIARQIADALEAAHDKGIVHRDLKPANVKVRPDGSVKVLDFGLAKSAEPAELTSDSPTMLSAAGMILGTAAYMSPEQARGKVVDKRADIWAFGVVLYEMLTGKRPFEGETTTEILSEVIKTEPSWTGIPPRAQRLLKSCLEKDPQKRLRDIGDAWRQLEDGPESAPPSRSRLAWGVTAVSTIVSAALLFAFLYLRPKPPAAAVQRFELTPPEIGGTGQRSIVSVSPDGTRLVFSHLGLPVGPGGLWVRRLDSLELRLLDGTVGAEGLPFWSPDSRFIAFGTSDGKLKKIEAAGGPAQTLGDAAGVYGGFWTADGRIVFSAAKKTGRSTGPSNELFQVPAAGGAVVPLPNVAHPAGERMYTPVLLPDRRHFVYLRAGGPSYQYNGIYLGSLDGTPSQNARRLLPDVSDVVYAPSPDPDLGYLLFIRDSSSPNYVGALMAQPFDLRKLDLAGEPVPVAERVSVQGGFTASRTGVLAYLAVAGANGDEIQPTLFDRQGKVLGPVGEPELYGLFAFSPDGTRVAAPRLDRQSGYPNIWITDLVRGVSARFTSGPVASVSPVWSPDGNQIAFESIQNGQGDLYLKLSNGGGDEELLLKAAEPETTGGPASWSRDGRFLLLNGSSGTMRAGWVLPLDSHSHAAGKPFLFERGGGGSRFSPDMRWVSYNSNESGTFEIYVQPFDPNSPTGSPPGGGKWLVSKGGGVSARWNGNGKELLYAAPDGTIMSVDVSANPAFHPGIPKPLFKTKARRLPDQMLWDVSPDGKKFLLPIPVDANTTAPPLTVVLNWQAGLKK